jgi:nucleotide-binding universal stress UspA family protein
MSITAAKPSAHQLPSTPEDERSKKAATLTLLVVVDGSERTGRVLECVKTLAGDGRGVRIILLSVQPQPAEGRIRGYGSFLRAEVVDRLRDLGGRAVNAAGRALTSTAITQQHRVEIGHSAETILRVAREENCDAIVIGAAPRNAIEGWLITRVGLYFGSPAIRVLARADRPVVVVK